MDQPSELSWIAFKTMAAAPTQTVTMLRMKLAFKIPLMKNTSKLILRKVYHILA